MNGLPPIPSSKGPSRPDTTDTAPIRERMLTIDTNRVKYDNAGFVGAKKDQFTFSNIRPDSKFSAYLAVKDHKIDIMKKATAVVFDITVQNVPPGQKPDLSVFARVIGGGPRYSFVEDVSGVVVSKGNNKYSAMIDIRTDKLQYYKKYATFPETFRIEAVRISGGPQSPVYITAKNMLVEK